MKTTIRILSIMLTILILGAFISLFQNGIHLSLASFWKNFTHLIYTLTHPASMTFQTESFMHDAKYDVFPDFFGFYFYTLTILFLGFLLSLGLAILLILITFQLSLNKRKLLIRSSTILESVPDVFVIVLAQMFFVFLFKKTGILVFEVVGGAERPYALPLLTYSILPTIFLYRTLILIFEEELMKPYVELATGKGLTGIQVLMRHVFRNSVVSLINHSKMIISFMLSNLIMLEILFNTYGLTWFVINHPSYEIATMSVILMFIPLFLLEEWVKKMKTKVVGG
ncbi:ABC transporter permease subunit [Rossellomorea aquimaris]|uniref:ABC transporter permease subunit n=1 Tax=Rossellomorea aquimaris TaxID=189382 RepID=UPI001CD25137|nr:ABC transporter permease subunit [Rossellomorea aquimaris]MCA1060398.1 ABC transporter permease subunit [Rossellomorea aquimaris]